MLTTATVSLVFILICFLFVYSKQDMLKRLFTNQLSYPTNELQDQLELTADIVIKNLESHITHLEDLLNEADERIEILDNRIQETKLAFPDSLELEGKSALKLLARQELQLQPISPTVLPYGMLQYQQQAKNLQTENDEGLDKMPATSPDVENTDDDSSTPQTGGQSFSQQRPVILAMFKQGYTALEIAKATGLGKGEILLFLQFHQTGQ